MSSASLKTETRLENFTSDEGGTFMMNLNNENYLKFGNLDFFPTKKNHMEPFFPLCCQWKFCHPKNLRTQFSLIFLFLLPIHMEHSFL